MRRRKIKAEGGECTKCSFFFSE